MPRTPIPFHRIDASRYWVEVSDPSFNVLSRSGGALTDEGFGYAKAYFDRHVREYRNGGYDVKIVNEPTLKKPHGKAIVYRNKIFLHRVIDLFIG